MSYPDQWILTKRYNEICVVDLFHPHGIILTGFTAVVVNHEIDHLYGKTMYDSQITRPQTNQKCWCNSGYKYKNCHLNKIIKS